MLLEYATRTTAPTFWILIDCGYNFENLSLGATKHVHVPIDAFDDQGTRPNDFVVLYWFSISRVVCRSYHAHEFAS